MLTFALLLAFAVSHAQTEKGTQTVGLDLQYLHENGNGSQVTTNNTTTPTAKYSNFNIGPQYSYFISDKLALGGTLSYGNSSNSALTGNGVLTFQEQTNKSYGGSVYLRKYLLYNDMLGLRVGPQFYYTHTNSSSAYVSGQDISNQSGSGNNYSLGLTAELVYYPTKHLGLSAMLANVGYSYYKTSDDASGSQTSKNTYLNFINSGLSLSVFYSFGGK